MTIFSAAGSLNTPTIIVAACSRGGFSLSFLSFQMFHFGDKN